MKIAICADIHGRRFLRSEIPSDVDLTLFAGDIAYLPHNVAASADVEEEIDLLLDTVNHMKSWPGKKIVIPGNHDHYIEEAFDFDHPAPPADRSVGKERGRLTESQKARIRDALGTDDEAGWYFLQHGTCDVLVGEHTLKVFGTGFSHLRNTDGYCFEESSAESGGLFKAAEGADIIIAHGPPYNDLVSLQPGETAGDRDSIDWKLHGSKSLNRALHAAKPGLVAYGHIHNAYSHHDVEYADGSTGLFVNAAAVIAGYKYGTMPSEGWRSEYLTPRPPVIVKFDTCTRKSTVVSSWDGTIRGRTVKPPFWAAPIVRMSNEEFYNTMGADAELSDASLVEAFRRSSLRELQTGEADAWLAKCAEDRSERHGQEVAEGMW